MAGYDQPIIIKKVKKAAHGHHGGAWKIAYADFVTAMMAFFLMLWLITMTTEEQKKGLADYFAPASVSETTSGAGGVLGGTTFESSGGKTSSAPIARHGVATESKVPGLNSIENSKVANGTSQPDAAAADSKASQADLKSTYDQNFQAAAASIKQAWQALPNITQIADNLLVEQTEDGLNIQIVDQRGRPMFPEGSKFPFEATRQAIAAIAPVLQRLPNQITISGHTAAGATYSDAHYGSWELSSDRANVVREILGEFGLSDDHVRSVTGRSSGDPFFPDDPYLPPNGRIEISVLYAAPSVPPDLKP